MAEFRSASVLLLLFILNVLTVVALTSLCLCVSLAQLMLPARIERGVGLELQICACESWLFRSIGLQCALLIFFLGCMC